MAPGIEEQLRVAEEFYATSEDTVEPAQKTALLQRASNAYRSIYQEFMGDGSNLKPALLSRYWLGLAKVAADSTDHRNGESYAELALKFDPASAEAWYVFATCQGYNGNLEGSIENYETSLRLKHQRPWEALSGQAYGMFLVGRKDEAFRRIGEAIELRPRYPAARHILSYMLRESGKDEESLRERRLYEELLAERKARTKAPDRDSPAADSPAAPAAP